MSLDFPPPAPYGTAPTTGQLEVARQAGLLDTCCTHNALGAVQSSNMAARRFASLERKQALAELWAPEGVSLVGEQLFCHQCNQVVTPDEQTLQRHCASKKHASKRGALNPKSRQGSLDDWVL